MRLAVFPLSLLLLPEGQTKLRIFEPRYQRLVRLALQDDQGFVLCPAFEPLKHGVTCHITDFEQLEDGMLGISIRASQRVTLEKFKTEPDSLLTAQFTPMPSWLWPSNIQMLALEPSRLKGLLQQHPIYAHTNNQQQLNDPRWCISRWLELLPFSNEARTQVLGEDDPQILEQLVIQLLSLIAE